MTFLLLILGFTLLIKGANYFVDGSSSIARIFKIPSIIIGLTIVAFGTSAPELAVNISAVMKDSSSIAIGNIVGSNIVNILLILGITSLIKPVDLTLSTLKKDFPFLIITTLTLSVLSLDVFRNDLPAQLSRLDGALLLGLFGVFFYYLIKSTIRSKEALEKTDVKDSIEKKSLLKNILLAALGLTAIIIGGNIVVEQSVIIARNFGISERIIGLTIVAVGTSLPELVTSVVAALKNESEIAIGNIIGSNIFNILFILGISSFIKPLPVDAGSYFDIIFLMAATLLTYIVSMTKKKVSRSEGVLLSLFYVAYVGYIITQF